MKTWLWRAAAIVAVAMVALSLLAMFGRARGEVMEFTLKADCLPGEAAVLSLTRDGLKLVESYRDRLGQPRERWERADGAWIDIGLGEGGWRCILAVGKPAGAES